MLPAGHSSYTFEFELPNGPFTHHGHYVNIEWWALAESGVASAMTCFTLEPSGASTPPAYRLSEEGLSEVASGEVTKEEVVLLILGMLLIFSGVAFTAWMWLTMSAGHEATVEHYLVLGGFLAFVLLGVHRKPLRRMLAELRVGTVAVEVTPRELHQAEALRCQVRCKPRVRTRIDDVRMMLVGREVVVLGTSTDNVTETHTFYEQPLGGLQFPERALAGKPLVLEGHATLPVDLPPSFYVEDNGIVWAVVVYLDIVGWPDWTREIDLHVLPGAGAPPRDEAQVEESETAGVAW